MTKTEPKLPVLLRLDARDQRGLEWLRERCRNWQYRLKRRRKYALPRGTPLDPTEAEVLKALADLERAAATLITIGSGRE